MTETPVAITDQTEKVPFADPESAGHLYWYGLIPERDAAEFLGLTVRYMQKKRQDGQGPEYVVISSRCLRYRRVELRKWSEARLRRSTVDPGRDVA